MITKKAIRCLKLIKMLKRRGVHKDLDLNAPPPPMKSAEEIYTNPLVLHEKKRELQEMFKLFDKSGDGNIDSSEMTELLKMMGMAESKQEVDEIMAQLDKDHGGTVDFNEFFVWMANQDTDDVNEGDVEELVEGIFGMIDKDGNGSITCDEFHDTLVNLGTDLSTEDIRAMMREVDQDGDGDLDKEEFTRMVEKYQGHC
jgi:Ca2+-binding EF-hand superfamily protein